VVNENPPGTTLANAKSRPDVLPDNAALSKLLGDVYDSVADPQLWDRTLEQLARHARATSAALLMHDRDHSLHSVARSWEVDPEGTRLYQEHYGTLDIWAHRASSITLREWVGTSEQLCSAAEFSESDYYNDFSRTIGIAHGAFALLRQTGNGESVVGVYRGQSQGEFDDSDLDLLRFMAPHLRRAFKLHLHVTELEHHSAGMKAAFDALGNGLVLVGPKGKIAFMNRAAAAIVEKQDGLIARGGQLTAEIRCESNQLEKLVREATSTSVGRGLSAGGALLISRRQGPPLQLLISPVRDLPLALTANFYAAVFVSDPVQDQPLADEMLRVYFGLTPAEIRVTVLLSEGISLRDISESLGVSLNTVKSQVSTIHAKTDTSRQAELVRLLMKLPRANSRPGGQTSNA
jgi:DNA-binding CsgD family transcriptional regulator/PAS domain-containing protein